MSQHVIVGAGPVGTATALMLAERGDQVRVLTRSGGGPEHPGIERVKGDATDADLLHSLTDGAVALYNCANPPYHQWLTDWPPLAWSLLHTAETTGATYVIMDNLYGYGPVNGPITPTTALAATHPKLKVRADMWRDALTAHEEGRVRATSVRASDFIEANGLFATGIGKALLVGKRAYSIAPLDVPHSWTSIADIARALTTVATDERAWGKAWLAPTNPALTVRQLVAEFVAANGTPKAKVSPIPYAGLWTMGLFSPMIRELRTTYYQFAKPFVIDSSETTSTFGLEPQSMDDALRAAAAEVRSATKA
jgi:nucleoside-diphosphate-sugar epimerase